MAVDYLTTDVELTSIADAIREKGKTSEALTYPDEFISAIQAIEGGTDVSDTTAVEADVRTGKYFYKANGTKVQGSIADGTITNNTSGGTSAGTINRGSQIKIGKGYYANDAYYTAQANSGTKTISASGTTSVDGYVNASVAAGSTTQNAPTVNSAGLVTATSTVIAGYQDADMKSNTLQLSTQAGKTVPPTESEQTAVASGKYTTGAVKVGAISSTYVGSGIDRKSSTDLIASGATVTASAGYYAEDATKTISSTSVTEGTTTVSGTTATRGTWSQTAGYTTARTVGAATFANSATSGKTYVDISGTTSSPVLVAGDYMYINKGYTDDLKISLAKLVPDGSDVKGHGEYILSGHSAYDNDGTLVAGIIPTIASTDLTVSGKTVTVPVGFYTGATGSTAVSADIAEGAYSASVTSASISSAPTYTPATSGTVTDISTTETPASGTDGTDYWTITPSGTKTNGNARSKATATISTAGYIAAGSKTTSSYTNKTITITENAGIARYIPKATTSTSSGTATVTGGSASTSVAGMVTTSTDTGYSVSASATGGNASVTASSITVGVGYNPSVVTASTTAKNASGDSASQTKYIQKGVLSASVSSNSGGSASMAATGFTPLASGTSDYYVTQSTSAGSVKAKASVGTEGYVKSETAETAATSVAVSGNGNKLYIPAGAYAGSVSSHSISTTPVVTGSITGTVTDIGTATKPSGTDGTNYWTITPSGSVTTTGVSTAKGKATISTAGYIPTGNNESSASTVNITPTVSAGTKRYLVKASTSTTNGTASATATAGTASIAKQPSASASATANGIDGGYYTDNTTSSYYIDCSASAASGYSTATGGSASASVTASSVTVGVGYNPSSVTASTNASSTGNKTGDSATSTEVTASDNKIIYLKPAGVTYSGGGISITTNYTGTPNVSVAIDSQTTSGVEITDTEQSSGYYITLTGSTEAMSGTTKATRAAFKDTRTAGYLPARAATSVASSKAVSPTVTVNAASKTRYLTIPTATFANTATSGTSYTDISSTGPVLIAGDYLYINKGWTPDCKISLSKLVPDGSDVKGHGEYIISGHSAYDNDGTLVAGTIPTLVAGDISVSGATVTVPVGKYTGASGVTAVTKTIDSGTVSTTFTGDGMSTYFNSGTSSDKNVTITPKYTNTAGYVAAHSTATNNGGTAYYKIKTVSGSIDGTASGGSATAAISNVNSMNTISDVSGKTAGTDYWSIKATATGSAGSYTPKYTVSTAGWIASTVTGTAQSVSVSSDTTGQTINIPKATFDKSGAKVYCKTAGYIPAGSASSPVSTIGNGTVVASVSSNTGGSASMAATGMTTTDTATDYYVTLSTTEGSVKAKAAGGTSGYVTSSTTNETAATSVAVSGNNTKLYIPAAAIAGSSTNATATTTVAPGTVSIANNTTAVSGKTRIDAAPTTATTGISTYYMAVKASAAANSTGTTSAISGSGDVSVTTAGYAPSTLTGSLSVSGTATAKTSKKDSSVYYIPLTSAAIAASGTASATTTVAPGTVSVAKQSTPSGVTNAASGDATTTAPTSGVYVAVKATAAANSNGTTSSITGTASATCGTAGWAATTLTGSGSVTGTATAKTSAKDSSVTYVPITTATPTFKGGAVSGTATASSSTGASLSTSTNNSGITIAAAASATRAKVQYNAAVAGWVSKAASADAYAAGSATDLTGTTYYLNGITLTAPSSGTRTFTVTVPNGGSDTLTLTFTVDSSGNWWIE